MGPYQHTRIVDVDETLSTVEEFLSKYGYAPRGEVAYRTQFCINGDHYSSVVAYTAIGVLTYRVKKGIFDAENFTDFSEKEVADAILPNMVGLVDNAAIHKTAGTRNAMERIFGRCYEFSSPDLKPVERLFAMVKHYLRDHEDESTSDPEGSIKAAFDMFRPGGPKAHHAANHFRMYADNHNAWLNF